MNSLCYPRMVMKKQLGLMGFSMLMVGAIQFLIVWLVTTIDYGPIVESMMEQLPVFFRQFFEEEMLGKFSAEGGTAFGFNHPIVLTLMGINAIMIGARHIAGEVEGGTLELLLSYPVKRTKLLLTLWGTGAVQLLLIVGAALISSIISVKLYHELNGEIMTALFKIAGNLWLLFVLVMSFTLVVSSFSKEASKAGLSSAAVLFVFYFVHFLSKIWEGIGFTKPFNIFTYYQPQQLMFGEREFSLNGIVLVILIFICITISIIQFNRRDIP
ncbi:MAG: ABC transporter permease subunit [Planctomycetes bacterium]|nr:ABC transporter permease subunit [Planctomycetota bacterium]